MSDILRYLLNALSNEADPLTSDEQLLRRYVRAGDEAAFERLVQRHGPMVWGVCERVLQNALDAEDAFQATFLVLVRRASALRTPASLGNWLYGVACRTAVEAREAAAKRDAHETLTNPPRNNTPDDSSGDLWPVFDGELERLPQKYRAVLVLCDLEGKSGPQVAWELGLAESGTVVSHQVRGRNLLAKRLTQRGVTLGAVPLATALSQATAKASFPATLVASTVKISTLFRAGGTGTVHSEGAFALAEAVLRAMFLARVQTFVAVTAAVLVAATGGALGTWLAMAGMLAGP